MKNLVLLCFRDINRKQKEVSDETLSLNTQVVKMVNRKINNIQFNNINNLHPHQRAAVVDELADNATNRAITNDFINSLSTDDPSTEPTEIRLDSHNLEKEVETSRRIGNIISFIVGDLGPEYKRLKTVREHLLSRNRLLTEQHIDHVNTGLEIEKLIDNNKGSLIDTYADTSAEMPSYMDPED